jgi:UDP-N-acetylglucosamine--N-acetylmuramyl-(pentapeptide) pyrophosphoryl-undecaprenol N-acetylglucosamine transferase
VSQVQNSKTVLIAGGGTGGHIYPGVAIAKALQQMHPEIKVHFVGARGGLEEKIIPREGFPLHLVEVGKLHKSVGLITRLKTLLQLPISLLQSAKILRVYRPTAVLGVGGFASGPLLFVASLMGYRTLIWEPNAYPGMTNRWLSRMVSECLVVFEDAGRFLHSKHVTRAGVPIRSSILPQARTPHPNLRVLVFGGSQGARAINNIISESVQTGGAWLDGVDLVHQTGPYDFARISQLYQALPAAQRDHVQCFEYLHDMDQRYHWADIVVCRAGASTVAEITAAQKAAVFIPLPTAADNHQQKNAEVLLRKKAAEMVLQKDFTPQRFQAIITDFHTHPERIAQLEEEIGQFQFTKAAERVVERLLSK